jgi:hypothetical protein
MNHSILFSETQKFKQWWIWVILIGINGTILFGIVQQLFLNQQFGDKPMSDIGLIITGIFITLISGTFFLFKLETQIKDDGIYVRFFPLQGSFRFYSWESISKLEVREYKPIIEYGGWGIRGFGKNRALNVSGNKGLQLEFKDGKKLLIGTNKSDELSEVIHQRNKANG